MSDKTWEEHWASGDTPWDAGRSAPSLHAALERLRAEQPESNKIRENPRAFVPGCGAGYDILTLAEAGYHAIGLDIAPSARQRFLALRSDTVFSPEEAEAVTGDYFEVEQQELGGPFDLMWDYTFFCAIEPHQREAWKIRAHQLLKPGGTLVMLIFPVVPDAPPDRGPPYPLDPQRVAEGLSTHFRVRDLLPAHASHPNREGREWLALFDRIE